MMVYPLQTLLELKLLSRLRWPLLLPPAAAVWMIMLLSRFSPGASQDLYLHLIDSQATFHTLSLGLPVLLGILLIRRDVLSPAYEWTHSLPVGNFVFIASKFTAGLLYMLIITLCVDAVYLLQTVRWDLSVPTALYQLVELNLLYIWSFGISLALGMTLGSLMPSRFALPIGFCAWLFGSVFIQYLTQRNGWYPLKAFYINQLFSTTLLNNEVWGPALTDHEYKLMFLFVAVFGLFLLLWSAAALGAKRPNGSRKAASAAALIALAAAAAAYIPYASMWTHRYQHLASIAAVSPALEESRPQERYAFQINSMKLDVYRLAKDSIDINAVIELPTPGGLPLSAADPSQPWKAKEEGRLTFLLHPSLEVSEVALNGKSVSFVRNGDKLSIPVNLLPAGRKQQTIRIAYHGKLNEWMYDRNGEGYWSFIKGDSLYLPKTIGWYPIPGGDSLFVNRRGEGLVNRDDTAKLLRADFDIRLHGFNSPLFATLQPAEDDKTGERHFQQKSAPAFTLFGGEGFVQVKIPGEPISIVTTPGSLHDSERFLQQLAKQRTYYEEWLPLPAASLKQIAYFPTDMIQNSSAFYNPINQTGNTVFFSESVYSSLENYRLRQTVSLLLFGDADDHSFAEAEGPDFSIVQEIRQAIIMMYTRESGAAGINNSADTAVSMLSPESRYSRDQLLLMIQDAAARGRMEQVKDTLKYFYKQGLSITMEQYSEAGDRGNDVREYYPRITMQDWLNVWNQWKGREARNE